MAVRDNAGAFTAAGNDQTALDPTDSLTYIIEASTTLANWGAPVVSHVTGTDATTIQTGLPALDAGWSYKTFSVGGSAAASFIRVKVTTP